MTDAPEHAHDPGISVAVVCLARLMACLHRRRAVLGGVAGLLRPRHLAGVDLEGGLAPSAGA